jgi:hypothetical protein
MFGTVYDPPLLNDWNVRRCNVDGCTNKPTTVVTQIHPDVPVCGFCEVHYQEAKSEGVFEYMLVFDEFDAFKESK